MQPIERAEKLRQEADLIMQLLKVHVILDAYGRWNLTGSYLLNVMAYPDLDIYINQVELAQIFAIGAQFAACELVCQVVYEPSDDPRNMPGGLYLKTRLNYGEWGRPWKIDIWSLPEEVLLKKNAETTHFLQKITPELRRQIIEYKLSILTPEQRTPMYSGYYIYKAFLDEGMTDFNLITHYLTDQGIHVKGQE